MLNQRVWNFLIGCSGAFSVSFVSALDLYFLILFFAGAVRSGTLKFREKALRPVYLAFSLFLVAHVVSGSVNSTPAEDLFSRVYLISACTVAMLCFDRYYGADKYHEYICLMIGAMVATAVIRFQELSLVKGDFVFKGSAEFVFTGLLLCCLLAARYKASSLIFYIVLLLFAALSLIFGARVFFGAAILGALVRAYMSMTFSQVRFGTVKITRGQFIVMLCIAAALFMSTGGVATMQDVFFGVDSSNRYEKQRGELGPIVGARVEVIGTLAAIKDRPLVGHGAWASNPGYILYAEHMARKYGYDRTFEHSELYSKKHRIPNHSVILGSWMEAGVVAAAAWALVLFTVLYLSVKILSGVTVSSHSGALIISILAVVVFLFAWNLSFSSLSNGRRYYLSMTIYFVIITYRRFNVRRWADGAR